MSPFPPHANTDNDAAIARAIAEQERAQVMAETTSSASSSRHSQYNNSNNNTSSINCPLGCGLLPFEVPPAQRVNCNVCGKRIGSGQRVYSCVSCNFDLCAECKQRGVPPVVVPGTSTSRRRSSSIPQSLQQAPPQQPQQPSSHMCIVPCVITGICVEMMVDSGACSSVMSLSLARRLGLEARIDRRHRGVAMGVGTANIVGRIRNVACLLTNVEFDIDFMVLDVPDQMMLLLGLDQMRKYQCLIDLQKEALIFGGSGGVEVPMLQPEQQHQHQQRRGMQPFRNPEECTIM